MSRSRATYPAMPAKAGKPTSRVNLKSHEREAQILRRAIELFTLRGLAVSTREIAEHCGITQPLLYRHFPSKQALIDRVYDEVYMSRWNPDWEDIIKDRSRPLEARLIAYFEGYSRAITANEWVRIFLFGALEDPRINQRYLAMLQERILHPILVEIRHESGLPTPSPAQAAIELEVIWGFHSSFFYLGVRRWVYRMPVPEDLSAVIQIRVKSFLRGITSVLSERK